MCLDWHVLKSRNSSRVIPHLSPSLSSHPHPPSPPISHPLPPLISHPPSPPISLLSSPPSLSSRLSIGSSLHISLSVPLSNKTDQEQLLLVQLGRRAVLQLCLHQRCAASQALHPGGLAGLWAACWRLRATVRV